MADTTRDIWNDQDGEEEKKRKKKRKPRHFLRFFLILAAVLAIVVFAAWRDGTGFDILNRYLQYGDVEHMSSGAAYVYENDASNRFALADDRLVVLSKTDLCVIDREDGKIWSTNVAMEAPALLQGNGRAVAYSVGGTELYVVDRDGEALHITTDDEEPLISARLNQHGWLAVTTEKHGYKGCVSVYDKELELVFEFKSSHRFVTDACVSEDGRFLAAVTLGQEEGVFLSNIVIYDLSKTDPVADYDVSDGLVAAIGEWSGQLVTVSDTCLTIASLGGEIEASYLYGNSHLRGYALEGDGFAALLLNRYRSGSVGRLVTVGPDGAELASLEINQEVLDISAAGRYLAVLYADQLVIYNSDLQVYSSLKGTDFAGGVLMRPDGSALLLAMEEATLFLP